MSKQQLVLVKDIHEESPNVKKFTLVSAQSEEIAGFAGGANITTYLPTEKGELARHYSLVGSPMDRGDYQIAVRLSERSAGGSLYWHQQVKVGDLLKVSWPRNHFPLSFRAKHHVFYAAGIGITPFLSMMAELKHKGISFELHYAIRTRKDCAFYEFLTLEYRDQCIFYFTREPNGGKLSVDSLLNHRIGTHVYFCGPEAMIQSFRQAALSYGYPQTSVHWERFAPLRPSNRHSFQVELARSRQVFDVPSTASVLDVLLNAGIAAPYSCKVGGCGSCELQVVEGDVDHQDDFLSEEQRRSQTVILPCVSRARGEKIILDI